MNKIDFNFALINGKTMDELFGKEVIITGPVVCKDGTRFEDYILEDHLKYLGFSLPKYEQEMTNPSLNTSKN